MKPTKIEDKHSIEEYAYNGNRLTKMTYTDNIHGSEVSRLKYDAAGKLLSVKFPNGEYIFTYDKKDRLIEESVAWKFATSGRLKRQRAGYSETNIFEYDSNGKMIKRTSTVAEYGTVKTNIYNYSYDAKGRVTKIVEAGSGHTLDYLYCNELDPFNEIGWPQCFLNDYIPSGNYIASITSRGSGLTNKVLKVNSSNYPTEVERIDWNNFKLKIKITY